MLPLCFLPTSRRHLLFFFPDKQSPTHTLSASLQRTGGSLPVLPLCAPEGQYLRRGAHMWPVLVAAAQGTPGSGCGGGRVTSQSPGLEESERWFSADCHPQRAAQTAEETHPRSFWDRGLFASPATTAWEAGLRLGAHLEAKRMLSENRDRRAPSLPSLSALLR